MKKTYQLKTNAIKGEQQVIDVSPAVGKAPVKVPAAAGARYELIDSATKAAPDNIRAMRKGKNLQIFFDGDTEPGAVIENFYQAHTDNLPTLVGRTEQGVLYEYIPESAAPSAVVSQLGDTGNAYGMALGGQELAASGAAVGLLAAPLVAGFSPLLLGAGVLGAAALAGGGGGGGDGGTSGGGSGGTTAPDPNPLDNTGKKTAISLNPVTGDNILSAAENTGSISLTGKVTGYFAANDIVTVYVNGKSYTGTTASDGSFKIDVAAADLAADKDTRIEAKVTGTGGDTANAAQDYAVETTTNAGKQTTLSIDPITTDNFINAAEANGNINVTGKATGAFSTSDTITLTINGKTYSGTPKSDGTFSIPVPAAELVADQDTTVDAVLGTSANALQNYGVDLDRPTNADVGLTIAIATDADNSGVVNTAELGNATKFISHITVNGTALLGDKVLITATNNGGTPTSIEHILTASDIQNGFDVAFDKPADGTTQVVSANYVDAAGNAAIDTKSTDHARLDVTAPTNKGVDLKIEITNDSGGPDNTNNDGYINAAEKPSDNVLTSHISFNDNAVVGDKIIVFADNDGTALLPITRVLSADDIANKGFDVTFAIPAEGKLQTVTANYVDSAGNAATDVEVKDTAKIDTHADTLYGWADPGMASGGNILEINFKPEPNTKITEHAIFTLQVGGTTYSGEILKDGSVSIKGFAFKNGSPLLSNNQTETVSKNTGQTVYLDLTDDAGNRSHTAIDFGNNSYTVDNSSKFNFNFIV